MYILIILIII